MCKEKNNTSKKKNGSTLEDGKAHEQEHNKWSRRDFLMRGGLAAIGTTGMLLGGTSVSAFAANPLLAKLNNLQGDRILVLIRLDGGNDGLNTIIPRSNDQYYNIRPNIAIQDADLWNLSDDFGMSNQMTDLQSYWNDGRMKVVHNVGYPDANYSHFRSSDIWASASDSDEELNTGWIGRFMDSEFPAFLDTPPVVPPALQIGVQSNLVFQANSANMALAISNPTEFYQIAQTGQLYSTSQLGDCSNELELSYLRHTANSAFRYSESIKNAYNNGTNNVEYPDNYFAEEMKIVARLIKGNLGTKVYMVSLYGFDTHADQANDHPFLMNYLSTAVNAFLQDIDEGGLTENVLAFSFSEFGRTIFENGSVGTDHGTGGPIIIWGGNDLGNGFVGEEADLINVDMYGDPYFTTDFRTVYASILQDWMCLEPSLVDYVIGQPTDTINGLVPTGTPPVGSNGLAALLGHNRSLNNSSIIEIKYAMKQRGTVRLQILDLAGHPIRTLLNEFKENGSYTFMFDPNSFFLPPGDYIYRLQTGGRNFSRAIKI